MYDVRRYILIYPPQLIFPFFQSQLLQPQQIQRIFPLIQLLVSPQHSCSLNPIGIIVERHRICIFCTKLTVSPVTKLPDLP